MSSLQLMRIPIGNVRVELQNHLLTLHDPDFVAALAPEAPAPIRTKYQDWYGRPVVLLTQILQRVILGVEGYVPAVVDISLHLCDRKDDRAFLRDPFSMGGRGTADNYYNRLPARLDPAYALRAANPVLWGSTCAFYRDVRNPIFHGHELEAVDIAGARAVLDQVCSLYDWIDEWAPLDSLLPGGSQLSHNRVGRSRTHV